MAADHSLAWQTTKVQITAPVSGFGTVQGHSAQDAGGVSTGGTDGQPVRTLSMIGLAACSTTPTEAAILPRLVETLS
jgi:hypothetical protein